MITVHYWVRVVTAFMFNACGDSGRGNPSNLPQFTSKFNIQRCIAETSVSQPLGDCSKDERTHTLSHTHTHSLRLIHKHTHIAPVCVASLSSGVFRQTTLCPSPPSLPYPQSHLINI